MKSRFPIAPLAADFPAMSATDSREFSARTDVGSAGRALDTFFPLCGTRWGPFLGCAYAPGSNRLLAPTSGVGAARTRSSKLNIYEPQGDADPAVEPEAKGIRQVPQLPRTTIGGPMYLASVDKFFLGVSSIYNDGTSTPYAAPLRRDTAFATILPASIVVADVLTNPAFEIEYIGGFDYAGFVAGGTPVYITSKDRIWIVLLNSTGQIAEIDPADNTFTIITDAAISAITGFVYCPADDCIYINCGTALKKMDVNTYVVSTVDISAIPITNFNVWAMTWVPDNGVDTRSGRIWISIADQDGLQPVYLLFLVPTTNAFLVSATGTASDFFVSLTFLPTIERIVAQKSAGALATDFRSYKADLSLKLIAARNLTGPGCYVDSLAKAALPVLKAGAYCVEFYTQAELS